MPNHHGLLRHVVVAAIIAILVTACVRESDENPNEGVDPPEDGVVVEVRLTDAGIEMPDEMPSGPIVFEVTNNGLDTHGFGIEETGDVLDELALDELDTLTVDLEPGTYTAFSPVEGDRENGLERRFTVVEADEEDNRDPADEGVGPSEEQEPIDDGG